MLNENGIHHKEGIVKWREIGLIEYEIAIPIRRYRKFPFCRAVIYTNNDNIMLVHAPLFLMTCAKKHSPNIKTSVSDKSKKEMAIMIGFCIVLVPLSFVFS